MQSPRVSVLALLVTGFTLASAVATADPPKVTAGSPAAAPVQATPPKLTLQAKTVGAPSSLTTEQKATLQKAVKAGIATWAKTKNASKAYAAGHAGLSGNTLKAYRASMTAFVSANATATLAIRYSIEGGYATVAQGSNCQFTIDAYLTVKNKIGGPFPTDKPAPTLEAVYVPTEGGIPIPGTGGDSDGPVVTAPVPRLAAGQSSTVRLTYSKTLRNSMTNQCAPPMHDLELNFLGVASMGVYVLRMNGTSGDLETLPLGSTPTNPTGIPDIPGGYPDGCQGWPKCNDGTCMLPNVPCGSY